MRLKNITATSHPFGNRIDLKWENPHLDEYPGIRVVRKERTHPTSPEDGFEVWEGKEAVAATDINLKGETVYYYTLFPYKGDPPEYQFDRYNRTAALATSPYNFSGQMFDLLPGVYHRYDTLLPKPTDTEVSQEDHEKGQLRRFLDIPGSQLDLLYSFARAVLGMINLEKVDGHMLPLLAQWIGWKTNHNLEIETQRNEIRHAPALYQRIGIIPVVEATVKRISGMECRTKEFIHNIAVSNRPERLNVWQRFKSPTGVWSESTEPLSLDFAYEGKPAVVRVDPDVLELFYHTNKQNRCDIWFKTLFMFPLELQRDLDNGIVPMEIVQKFENKGYPLSQVSRVKKIEGIWIVTDSETEQEYTIRLEEEHLTVWTPSRPLTHGDVTNKHPVAVVQGGILWVFWDSYDETDKVWHINYRTRSGREWSSIATLSTDSPEDLKIERRQPRAVVDHEDGFWLFWLERSVSGWILKYNRYDGPVWDVGSATTLLTTASSFPMDGGENPRVEIDPFVFLHPTDLNRGPWVFWARKERAGDSARMHWTVVYRIKDGIDPANVSDWGEIRTYPKDPSIPDYHDREPACMVNADGNIELFWSSNRSGSWSIWQNTLDIHGENWDASQQNTDSIYSQRDPLPFSIDDRTLLFYRSNESISYTSQVYGATETTDFRHAGSTTLHARDAGKIAMHGKFEDFQTYTCDVGLKDNDWYSRGTVGFYLTTNVVNAENIGSGINRINSILAEFMPVTTRAVFITPPLDTE